MPEHTAVVSGLLRTIDLYVNCVAEASPSTSINPEVTPQGIVTLISVLDKKIILLIGITVAPILTTEELIKSVPIIVTTVPA